MKTETSSLRLLLLITALILIAGLNAPRLLAQGSYDLPNDDANCPAQCRQIPWDAGSDLWNGGTLPSYPTVACSGLAGNGTTDDGPAIQACIDAQPGTAANPRTVVIPAGVYYVNASIDMKSYVALRGAKSASSPWLPNADATATTFKLGTNGAINFGTETSSVRGPSTAITSGYTKGSTQLVLSSMSGVSVGTWFLVSENPDPAIPVTSTGEDGNCSWCGWDDNTGRHIMNQIVQVTAINQGGCGSNCVTISRPMYYTFKSTLSPVFRTLAFEIKQAGVENIRLDGSAHDHRAFIRLSNSLFCWVKGVETYLAGSQAKDAHILSEWSNGNEYRDSYHHYGRDFSSDKNYGIYLLFVNSDHKIENNIIRVTRHPIALEGGGAGIAFLYNYLDDTHEDDLSYLGAGLTNHGAHPYMNLYEGNIASHLIADEYWGSSSHNVLFRNWLWGDNSVPSASEWLYPAGALTKPNWGFRPIEIWTNQHYYSLVGNVLGVTGKWQNPSWSSYTLLNNATDSGDGIYNYGYRFNSSGGADSAAYSTSINHGNYDFKTGGVAFWDGGSNHTLKASMYYFSKPSFFGGCPWPAFGPDLNPITNTLPAKARYEASSACSGGGGSGPTPPTGLAAIVN